MAITNYTELQAAIGNWLHRGDLSAVIPDFIMLFEQEANRRLRVREQEAYVLITMSSGGGILPTDYLSWREAIWNPGGDAIELEYATPTYMIAKFGTATSGVPRLFTISGNELDVERVANGTIGFTYFQKIPPLSVSNPTNWLLTKHPDVYLFGSLAESHGYAMNPDALGGWIARRDVTLDEIQALSNKSRGVGPLRILAPTP